MKWVAVLCVQTGVFFGCLASHLGYVASISFSVAAYALASLVAGILDD